MNIVATYKDMIKFVDQRGTRVGNCTFFYPHNGTHDYCVIRGHMGIGLQATEKPTDSNQLNRNGIIWMPDDPNGEMPMAFVELDKIMKQSEVADLGCIMTIVQ